MSTMSQQTESRGISTELGCRHFVHPIFDYMLIGGGLSLVVVLIVMFNPYGALFVSAAALPYFVLLSNSTHFAASTVRLYTKPGAYQSMPFLTMALPLVALAILSVCMFYAGTLGPHLMSLYLTWSPYHYAAQAYGLSVMYCYRSGCMLGVGNKKLLWWTSMIPFMYNFVVSDGVGLHWIDTRGWLETQRGMELLGLFELVMPVVAVGAMIYLIRQIWRTEARPMPVICLLMLIANAIWWFLLPALDAFVWATIFHGIQYLAIVIIFHLKDQMSRPENRHGITYHVLWFYGVCLLLGYGLFNCFPRAFMLSGFGPVESVLLVAGAINIHHFIVDAYIWRLKKTDTNRKIVDAGAAAPA